MNHLDFILDTKAVTEDGQIEGLAAGYGNIDAGGDVIVPGALDRDCGSGPKHGPRNTLPPPWIQGNRFGQLQWIRQA